MNVLNVSPERRGNVLRHGTSEVTPVLSDLTRTCSISDCTKPVHDSGMCGMHARRWRVYGDPLVVKQARHGHYGTPTHQTYKGMLLRCYKPYATQYAYYGGRGIMVCERWLGVHGFENFLADMGERPDGLTLDRKHVNGDYAPENCRWATKSEQAKNIRPRRRNAIGQFVPSEAERLLAQLADGRSAGGED